MSSAHILIQLRHAIANRGEQTALRCRLEGQWQDMTWQAFDQQIQAISRGLLALKVAHQDKVGIMAGNSGRWISADIGIMSIGAVTVPIYPGSSDDQVAHIVKDAEIDCLIVAGEQEFAQGHALLESGQIRHLIRLDQDTVTSNDQSELGFAQLLKLGSSDAAQALAKARLNALKGDDLFTLIYTSGTTGEPKGVMLDYDNMHASFTIHDDFISVDENDESLAFLPLSHVFERAWSLYCLRRGATVAFLNDPRLVVQALSEIKPTLLASVPRLFEKIHAGVFHKLESASATKRRLFGWATRVADKALEYQLQSKSLPAGLALQHKLADKLVLSKLRGLLGGRIRFMPCGGAKLDATVVRFFHSLGLNVICGYGMTETSATVAAFAQPLKDFGSCGKPLPGLEIRLGADNEIQVKGATVMRGYYNRPEATDESFDGEWLKTGDAGEINEAGELVIVERIKELMKTSNGKYVAPQRVEGAISQDHFIEQVAIIADGHHFVSALVVPSFEALEEYAKAQQIRFESLAQLLDHDRIKALLAERIAECQQHLAPYERVKQYRLLAREFSAELGELTPTMKLKRRVINQNYREQIAAMYRSKAPA
ncbi:AMP-dependent synthetase/ligase [Paraferrimonas sedimenticola]|uniref:Long-chain-fatty-acid--CoA ligase n=1 Tax=Paraferrimonas sedimenticola TaxID=375674 RepID=A0AA37RYU5_9GAMM|nr:long-chain fatty acid--CoA ligase [Paraferrimonas sedimenticola]GLP97788.1 long-chain-fatty-acid--CoA ligase [Paraferrimonas sedimenticola]